MTDVRLSDLEFSELQNQPVVHPNWHLHLSHPFLAISKPKPLWTVVPASSCKVSSQATWALCIDRCLSRKSEKWRQRAEEIPKRASAIQFQLIRMSANPFNRNRNGT